MFESERFIERCRQAVKEHDPTAAVREVVAGAVSRPGEVLQGIGEPTRATIEPMHVARDLTILNLVWGPGMTVMPHDHRMPAIIGVYTGGEDNIFWRRIGERDGPPGRIEAASARSLREGDVGAFGPETIHSVTNPISGLTAAIHVYLGPFFYTERSEWDPRTLLEGPYDTDKAARLFEESNSRLAS